MVLPFDRQVFFYQHRGSMITSSTFRLIASALCGCLLALLSGCKPSVEHKDRAEWADERLTQARQAELQAQIDDAIRLCKAALNQKPDLAMGHLELALLLHAYTTNYVDTIYHYQQYLELSPNSEKTEFVKSRIRTASQQFAVSVGASDVPGQSGEAKALEKENLALQGALKDAEEKFELAKTQIHHLQEQLNAEETKSANLWAKLSAKTTSATAKTPVVDTKPRVAVEPDIPTTKTYQVLRGDTLSKIALKVYKDPDQWRKIFDANRETLGGSERVQPGQVLLIP